jgi:hypothetical protein
MNLFRKPSLSRERVEALKFEAMLARNERRRAEARAYLKARGISPMPIGTAWIPVSIARTYTHMNVRGLA